jgi:hypothetical protein
MARKRYKPEEIVAKLRKCGDRIALLPLTEGYRYSTAG